MNAPKEARAARERILFERIENSLQGKTIPQQSMLIPPMLELSPLQASLMADQLSFFERVGFEIEPFGRHLFRIRSIPAWMQSEQPELFVEELLQKISNRGLRPGDTHPARTMVARMAAIGEARGFSVRDTNDLFLGSLWILF